MLGSTASSHTDGSTVSLLTVTADKTEINETTATGIVAPLIKNDDLYEANVETAANNWKWAAKTAGKFGNSLRVVITDAGPDQVIALAQPTTAEWEFTAPNEVAYSAANIYGKVYSYTVVATVAADATLIGSFEDDNFYTAVSGGVTGRIVAWDKSTRELEITIDGTSSDVLEVGDTLTELANNSGSAGSATGDSATIEAIRRELRVSLNSGSPRFQANQVLADDNAASISIAAVESDYDSRLYGPGQKWASIAPRPTTSAYAEDRGGHNDLLHVLIIDGDGALTGTPGALLEKHLNVSKASDAKSPQGDNIYYKDVIKNFSQFLHWGSHEQTDIYDRDPNANGSWGMPASNRDFDLLQSTNALKTLDDPLGTNPLSQNIRGTKGRANAKYIMQGGVDGYTVSRPNILGAYNLFDDAETIDVDYILMGPGMSSQGDTIAKAQHIISIAASRKDCMAFVSPHRSDVVGQPNTSTVVSRTVDYFDQLGSSSYAVFDNNYKYIYDKYNDVYRYIPCNGDMAGLILSTTLNQEPCFSRRFQPWSPEKCNQTCILSSEGSQRSALRSKNQSYCCFPWTGYHPIR